MTIVSYSRALFSLLITLVLFFSTTALAEVAESYPGISLSLSLGKNEAYPGETVPVTVILRIRDATVRNIGYPLLTSPTGGKVVFSAPVQESEAGDPSVTLHRFTGQISGITPGDLTVGPARLDCEVMKSATGSAAFFGGQEAEPVKLFSATAPVTILPLPAAGKPALFSGAIGTFALTVKSLPAQVVIGEPLTVTTKIKGTGSLVDADCPTLGDSVLKSFPVRATRSVSHLTCEQVLVPNGLTQFSPVTWNYFDPDQRRYVLLTGTISSQVITPLTTVIAQSVSSAYTSTRVPSYSKPMVSTLFIVSVLVIVIVILVLLAMLVRKRRKMPGKTECHRNISQLKVLVRDAEEAALKGDVELFYNLTFEIIQCVDKNYTAASGGIRPDQHADNEDYHRLIEVKYIIAACDRVRYGRIMPNDIALASDFKRLKKILPGTF